ncbi:MAG: oxidative damage protection protein [Gammaproteobacteria bacterium]|nr:oxidative damage protection protein [Gammaproteobacteria bacterium]
MSQRLVNCIKYGSELPGLDAPPMPGPLGQEIYDTVSAKAWQEWTELQTMLINENHLSLRDPSSRRYLNEQRKKFFANEDWDRPEGYTPSE